MGVFVKLLIVQAKKVILNDPATVAIWDDGTKTVSKAGGGDEYDPLFGIMACALRKVGRNRVRIDAWEWLIAFLADNLADADECRLIADMLDVTAGMMEMPDVAKELDRWADGMARDAEPVEVVEAIEVDQDRLRETIRNLRDEGEL